MRVRIWPWLGVDAAPVTTPDRLVVKAVLSLHHGQANKTFLTLQ